MTQKDFEDLFACLMRHGVNGSSEVMYIGKNELILAKRAAGRPQDLVDVATLTELDA